MRLLKLLLVLLVCAAGPAVAGPFEDAAAARGSGDYATALRLLRPLADQGIADAQYYLGLMYDKGEGVPQNYAAAAAWYRKAADQGDEVSSVAQLNLGSMYDKGEGVPQNYAVAAAWYRKAADQGNGTAQLNLGNKYFKGEGVSQNYAAAAAWYRKAADKGASDAQYNLGNMYFKGQGVPQDYGHAHMWFNLAAAQNNANAIKNRDIVAKQMTPVQIAEAQKLAREWKPNAITLEDLLQLK